jgi:hypothetical protein
MLTKMQKLGTELVEVRGKLSEIDDTYRELRAPWEQKREVTQQALFEEMRKTQTLSTRYEDFTISGKITSKAVVNNEAYAIEELRLANPLYLVTYSTPVTLFLRRDKVAGSGIDVAEVTKNWYANWFNWVGETNEFPGGKGPYPPTKYVKRV